MAKARKEGTGRREFLKTGVVAAIGIGCLRGNLREALAQANDAGKPLFMPANINKLIAKHQSGNPAELRALANQAKADPKGFIAKNFYLTPRQQHELDALEPRHMEVITTAIDQAGKGVNVKVRIVEADHFFIRYDEGETTRKKETEPVTKKGPSGGDDGTTITISGHCKDVTNPKDCDGGVTIGEKK